jgi:16S rRNA (uracil1498-N3)-methyltransferase
MIRVLAAAVHESRGPLELLEQEEHHLRVRRAADGDPVEVLDGRGGVGQGVVRLAGKRYGVELSSVRSVPRPDPLVLLVGAGDRERFAWLVEKAAELGATAVIPLGTARALNVTSRVRDEHRPKLARRALETLKQCGGAWAPEVGPVTPLDRALAAVGPGLRWLADPRGTRPEVTPPATGATVIIGPEGGFEAGELVACRQAGFESVRLGSRMLRFETAAIAALALIASGRTERNG